MSSVPVNAAPGKSAIYAPSRVKRMRRTDTEIGAIKNAITEIVEEDRPMTLRGHIYRPVAAGVIPKQENEHTNTRRYLLQLRRGGRVPYQYIADNTRWMRKQASFDTLEHALNNTAARYRRALWHDQNAYVEVWCDKGTLAGVLMTETGPYDVPLVAVRGFSSETYLHESAQTMEAVGRPVYLYLLTDLDPSGLSITADIERKIRGFIPDTGVTVQRIAVTSEQVDAWSLPTRPTKRTDSRAKTFEGESVELDAIPPAVLRRLVREAIETHIDAEQLRWTKETERLERDRLYDMYSVLGGDE